MHLSLHQLPVHIIYQILDHLEDKALFLSIYDVCQYLNAVINSYDRFRVKINFIFCVYQTLIKNLAKLIPNIPKKI